MKKENRPGQQAANNIDIRGSDVTPPAPTTQVNHNADAGGYPALHAAVRIASGLMITGAVALSVTNAARATA
ncbi:hypothetical protein [Enterobacter roggenkampii]|uniref:hypothetical protein n=1 Tax=Enterobacter roggenkampii TaxID=1812935 RepID=UPI002FD7F7CA